MSTPTALVPTRPDAPRPPSRRRRRRRVFMMLTLGMLLVLTLGYWGFRRSVDRRLQQTIDALDRADPGWRLENLAADQEPIPDEQNAALKVLEAEKELPANWRKWDQRLYNLLGGPPEVQLTAEAVDLIREELRKAGKALGKSRELATYTRGRFPVEKPEHDHVSTIFAVLYLDQLLLTHEGDQAGALRSCRAAFQTMQIEGAKDYSLYRLSRRSTIQNGLERTLAHGEAAVSDLELMQHLLEHELTDEAARPLLTRLFREVRADLYRSFTAYQNGARPDSTAVHRPPVALLFDLVLPDLVKIPYVVMLEYFTSLHDVAELPIQEQDAKLKELEEEYEFLKALLYRIVPQLLMFEFGSSQTFQACSGACARLRCTYVALAVERFRREHRRWPETLAELGPLPGDVGLDPFDAAPLRYRRLADGVVVYSIGPNGQDDGGRLSNQLNQQSATATDVGFRLWDVPLRRQPPPPPPPPQQMGAPRPAGTLP